MEKLPSMEPEENHQPSVEADPPTLPREQIVVAMPAVIQAAEEETEDLVNMDEIANETEPEELPLPEGEMVGLHITEKEEDEVELEDKPETVEPVKEIEVVEEDNNKL